MQFHFSRQFLVFALITLIGAFAIVWYYNAQPGYTDAFYHYNAAQRLAAREGFVDDYLWVYTGLPESLPAPSHLYWMPGTSIIAAAGMMIFGQTHAAAQVGFALCLWGTVLLAYVLGKRIGGTTRHAWFAGLMMLFGGFYLRHWGIIDTYAPYALFGALCLFAIGQGLDPSQKQWRWWLLGGLCAGAGHLIRNDGLLLLLVGVWCLVMEIPIVLRSGRTQQAVSLQNAPQTMNTDKRLFTPLIFAGIFIAGYLLLMMPWFIRNLQVSDAILPVGGTRAIWYLSYNDLFNYPPDANAARFFEEGGFDLLLRSRLETLFSNDGILMSLLTLEGMVILTPFMLMALWQHRRNPFFRAMIWFVIGIHGAFAFLFTFPALRGSLLHAVVALLPFWIALALNGLDRAIAWLAKRRRSWNPRTAKPVFATGMLIAVIGLSLVVAHPTPLQQPGLYPRLEALLPEGARIMINDAPQLYYYTGRGGVVTPNESVDVIPEIAERYDIDYLVVEFPNVAEPLWHSLEPLPDFLRPIDLNMENVYLYEILRERPES